MIDDPFDRAIIALLLSNGRMSYTNLGRYAGLAVSSVYQRVLKLQRLGVITGYTAQVDPTAIGVPVSAFLFITGHGPSRSDLIDSLTAMREIDTCHAVAGPHDYLAHAHVASLPALDTLLRHIGDLTGVSVQSAVVLTTPFLNRPLIDPEPAVPAGRTAPEATAQHSDQQATTTRTNPATPTRDGLNDQP
jgi:Lrp/AsnC family leucine-responsive transcriptional regulator